jgi:lysyl-tRNA synthetase class 2
MSATDENIRKIRVKKLQSLRVSGVAPFPSTTRRNMEIGKAVASFGSLAKSDKEVVLAGRIKLIRIHGGSTFLDLADGTGDMQAYFKRDRLGEKGYKFFLDNFDLGDFIEIKGTLFETKKGEKTLEVADFKMLAKSLRPLPEKWHGLKDTEERYRKRYLDLIFNKEIKDNFAKRSAIIKEIRRFLESEGFLEVETPILQPLYGGARAQPFKTYMNALDIDLYLRVSPELYLKRLLIGGFEKVYEIGKCFRNEGVDRSHNPDFTVLEFYWAYADYKKLMKLTERMFTSVAKKVFNKLKFTYEGQEIDFTAPWPRMEFSHILSRETGIDIGEVNRDALAKEAKSLGVPVEKNSPKFKIADEIFKKVCRPKIQQPTFIIHYPKGFQPLAKSLEGQPDKLANFQLIAAGWEMLNAFSELNDPLEQRKRFEEQENLYEEGFGEAQRMDKDFLKALEYGMPPAAGFGMGLDRFTALLTGSHSLREVILFPTMRPKKHKK